jgi:hypothetical protein
LGLLAPAGRHPSNPLRDKPLTPKQQPQINANSQLESPRTSAIKTRTADERRLGGWTQIFQLNISVYLRDIRVYLRLKNILRIFADL